MAKATEWNNHPSCNQKKRKVLMVKFHTGRVEIYSKTKEFPYKKFMTTFTMMLRGFFPYSPLKYLIPFRVLTLYCKSFLIHLL
jgi:hypothetical protein